jgi:large subunit ribosomal protein L18
MKVKTKKEYRVRRHYRLRKKIRGSADCPRMSVFVSNRHMYVQLIDDDAGKTLASVSTVAADGPGAGVTAEKAAQMGRLLAERVKEMGVTKAVFDRGGFTYGKRLKALADAAREAGLEF